MREDNDSGKLLISVAGALVNLLVALILLLALLYLVLVLISGVDGINEFTAVINDTMTNSSEIMTSLLTISVAALALAFLVMFVCWLSKDEEGVIILPFEVPEDEKKYSGKALSHLLTAELLRIDRIRKTKSEPAPIKVENINFPVFKPPSENVSSEIGKIGTVEAGTASIPLGQILVTIKRLWPWGTKSSVISGCLQKYGSATSLIACHEHQNMKTWEARKIRERKKVGDEIIADLTRDLAYMIVYDLSRDVITAKTWQGFKYFFEALDEYHRYTLTGYIGNLERARTECLKSSNSEIEYNKLIEMLYNLGVVYSSKKEFSKAEELLLEAEKIKGDFHPVLLMLGYLYGIQNKHKRAIYYFDKALDLNPNDVDAIYGKGIAFTKLNLPKIALQSFDRVIKLNKEHVDAMNQKGDILLNLKKYDEAEKCFESVIKLDLKDVDSLNFRGDILLNLNRYGEALKCFEKSADLYLKSIDMGE